MRAIAYIDGFNLYHAIKDTGLNHLKWLNLRSLALIFAPPPHFTLTEILYFTAYAKWRPDAYRRHREYVKALQAVGVTPVLGRFKIKDRICLKCMHEWKTHEEKETDINIALHMLSGAYDNAYDIALLFSADSDFVPTVELVRRRHRKRVKVITPSNHHTSGGLIEAAGGRKNHKKLLATHMERSLLGKEVKDGKGNVIAVRPSEYDPPA